MRYWNGRIKSETQKSVCVKVENRNSIAIHSATTSLVWIKNEKVNTKIKRIWHVLKNELSWEGIESKDMLFTYVYIKDGWHNRWFGTEKRLGWDE